MRETTLLAVCEVTFVSLHQCAEGRRTVAWQRGPTRMRCNDARKIAE